MVVTTTTYRVSCGNLLELLRRRLVSAGPVRVVLERELLVGGVDLLLGRSPRHLFGLRFINFFQKKMVRMYGYSIGYYILAAVLTGVFVFRGNPPELLAQISLVLLKYGLKTLTT